MLLLLPQTDWTEGELVLAGPIAFHLACASHQPGFMLSLQLPGPLLVHYPALCCSDEMATETDDSRLSLPLQSVFFFKHS